LGIIKSPHTPSRTYHKTVQVSLDKDQLWELKSRAEDANDQNTQSSYVSLASYMIGFINGDAGQLVGTIANMMQSKLDAFREMV